jgi:pSer/pThr/pTyr-binding forkhead associated (FHA) protein
VASLAVYRGEKLLRQVELGKARTRIGRGSANEVVLEDPDKRVSRSHAEILYEAGSYVVVDLDSQNGVWIADRRVKRGPLPVDVPVTIGPYRLRLVPDPLPPQAPDDSAGPVLSHEGQERLVEATEIVRPEVRVAAAQAATPPEPEPASPPVPMPRKRSLGITLAVAGVVTALAAVLLVVVPISRRAPSIPPVTEAPLPAGPTVEDRFQDHYAKAQGFIQQGDKASAGTENAEALKVLPSDPRGLKQQADIAAMIDIPTPPSNGVLPPGPPPPGGEVVSSLPTTLRVAPKAGETASQRTAREKLARNHLDDGKNALADHRYPAAIGLFQAALEASNRPDYGYVKDEASNLLQEARTSQARVDAGQKRDAAQKLVENAKALAGSDTVGAIRKLREARSVDPQVAGATELLNSLQEQARIQGESALTSARNYDLFKRTEQAIRDFDLAVQLLELVPGGHKDLASARLRSAELKKRK